MKNLFLSIALLVAVPTFSSHSTSSVEAVANGAMDAPLTIVCVGYKVTGGPWVNDPYFYTSACARTFQRVNGGTIVTGTFCVDEGFVFVCL